MATELQPTEPPCPAPVLMEWRGFHTELQRAAVAATQTGAPLSLLMLELMSAGPRQPRVEVAALAGLVKAVVGERSFLARYTEERLAVIMVETDLGDAIARAERIGRSLRSRNRDPAGGVDLEGSPVIGIAQFHADESLGHLIQRTAEALRQARFEGGDREPPMLLTPSATAGEGEGSGA